MRRSRVDSWRRTGLALAKWAARTLTPLLIAACGPHPSHTASAGREAREGESDGLAEQARSSDPLAPSESERGAGGQPESGPSEAGQRLFPGQLSVLLITVDTLRPDLGFMGYPQAVSPNLDRFAQHAVIYDRAYAISTYTGFCLPPMMASRYPSEMPRTDRHEVKYLKSNVLLAERLRAGGFHTAGAASHFLFAPELGWIDGFERFAHVQGEGDAPPGAHIDRLHSSRRLADAAIRLLADPRVTSGPFFIWVHFLDPHKKYLEHPGFSNFGGDSRGLYDGEIAFTDFHIGRVLDALASSALHERTAVVFTADHGEAFGEHGKSFHGSEVWDEIVRIPLAVALPGARPRRISRRVSAVDVAPTILELAGLPEDEGARGSSLVAELAGHDLPERPVLVDQPHNPYYVTRRAYIEGDYKLHHYPESETYRLFDLAHDPSESRDLVSANPELLQHVQASYEAFMATVPQVVPRAIAPWPPKAATR